MTTLKELALRTLPYRIAIPLQKRHYVRQLRRFSEIDEPDVAIVRRLVGPGDTVVDIGAHVGWYTRILSESVGLNGTVHSFEPIPCTFEILRYCLRRLKLTNVAPRRCGVSDVDRTAMMYVPKQSGGYNFYQSRIDGRPERTALRFPVELRSIDNLCGGSPKEITFIKCDVEGHDLEVVKGSCRTVDRWKPAWMIEVSGNPDAPGSRADELFAILRAAGYSAWWYDGERLRERSSGDNPINCFFLTAKHLSHLAEQGVEGAALTALPASRLEI